MSRHLAGEIMHRPPHFYVRPLHCWKVGRCYRDCYKEYLKGNKQGLWEKINKACHECLRMRVDVRAFLCERLRPEKEPPVHAE